MHRLRLLLVSALLLASATFILAPQVSAIETDCAFADDAFCSQLESSGSCEYITNSSDLVDPADCGSMLGTYCANNAGDPACSKIPEVCVNGDFPAAMCDSYNDAMANNSLTESQASADSDNDLMLWGGIGIAGIVLVIITVILVARRSKADDSGYTEVDAQFDSTDDFVEQHYTQQGQWNQPQQQYQQQPLQQDQQQPQGPPPRQMSAPSIPTQDMRGELADDGFEWLEHPGGSDSWYYRDQNTHQWVVYQG